MNWRCLLTILYAAGVSLVAGCSALLPRRADITQSEWTNYTAIATAFEQVVPYQTRTEDLKKLGFHPLVSPNVKILTYVEVTEYFMPNPAITKADLNPAVRDCIEAKELSQAYLVELKDIRTRRYGNLILDMFGFKRRTHESGWRFKGLILATNNIVVYKLSSGDPAISTQKKQVKPLGPIQELDGALAGAAVKGF